VWEQPEGGTAETGSILLRNYEVKEEGTQTVAGRQAWVLALRCRARRMLAKRLWVDRETYATLGSEDYDCRGLCRSRSMMTQVGFGEVRDTLVAPGGLGCTRLVRDTSIQELPLDQVASRLGFLPRFPGYVPQHFERVGTCLSHCPCGCGALSAQIRYTDGLRSFSVFETNPLHCRCSSRESCARGAHLDKATSCYVKEYGAGAVVSNLQGEQTVVVVVGDLSKEEMIRVGASARTSAESR
jgi:negative regulator of sigma E activity